MKVLIAYASKGGTTATYAKAIAETLKKRYIESDLSDLSKEPDMEKYKTVIVGTGVRAGSMYKEALKLLKLVSGRKVYVFISSLEPETDVLRKYAAKIKADNPTLDFVSFAVFGGRMNILWKSIDKTDVSKAKKWADEICKAIKT